MSSGVENQSMKTENYQKMRIACLLTTTISYVVGYVVTCILDSEAHACRPAVSFQQDARTICHNATYITSNNTLNNKLLRIIQDKPRRTHIIELYENYSPLPVILLHQQNLILFAHNILHCPYKLPDLFKL